jgi:hypothetical protein
MMNNDNNNNNESNMTLKPEGWVKRKYSPKIKEHPKRPLSPEQKKQLADQCTEKCWKAYRSRMTQGLLSDFETSDDLRSEAYIAMIEILERFDLDQCGPIAEFDVPGKTSPKTLAFYFNVYFSGRVNFMACEARTHKKALNVQNTSSSVAYNEVVYNPIDEYNGTGENQNYEITGHIMNELANKSRGFRRFFYQRYILQCSYKELVDEYGQEECKERSEELQEFTEKIKKNYKSDFGSPYKKKRERGRKKKTVTIK